MFPNRRLYSVGRPRHRFMVWACRGSFVCCLAEVSCGVSANLIPSEEIKSLRITPESLSGAGYGEVNLFSVIAAG